MRPDRGAGDDLGPDAQFVEHLQHQDVREPARAAAAQRQRDARHARRVGQACGLHGLRGHADGAWCRFGRSRDEAGREKRDAVRPACPCGFSSARKWPESIDGAGDVRCTSRARCRSGIAGQDSCGPRARTSGRRSCGRPPDRPRRAAGRWWRRRDSPRTRRERAPAPAAARDSAPAPRLRSGERSRALAQLLSVCSR